MERTTSKLTTLKISKLEVHKLSRTVDWLFWNYNPLEMNLIYFETKTLIKDSYWNMEMSYKQDYMSDLYFQEKSGSPIKSCFFLLKSDCSVKLSNRLCRVTLLYWSIETRTKIAEKFCI